MELWFDECFENFRLNNRVKFQLLKKKLCPAQGLECPLLSLRTSHKNMTDTLLQITVEGLLCFRRPQTEIELREFEDGKNVNDKFSLLNNSDYALNCFLFAGERSRTWNLL